MNEKTNYLEFLESKKHSASNYGIEPMFIPDAMFDYQKYVSEYLIKKGRAACFLDTGLGKTIIELTVAKNYVQHTNKPVLIICPLAVAFQFIKEAEKFGIDDISYSKDGNYKTKIVVCNYERLEHFNSTDFDCVMLDESSILKNFDGAIKQHITTFLKKVKYRFLFTATPAPNDYIEFGTSSEALGYLPYMDMLQKFFRNNENNIRPQDIGSKWYLKPHAKENFFSWLTLWSLHCKKPSDLGFSDERHKLPELIENIHEVFNKSNWVINGQMQMFNSIAKTMSEVRTEQQGSEKERCEKAFELSSDSCVYWCNFNNEGDLLAEIDKDAVQIKGSMLLEKKEDILLNFANGSIKKLITKPKITSFGLNWQHINHTIYFPTWSYEQYYQAIRRFWRFGQKRNVTVDLVISDGQKRVIDTLLYKTQKAKEFTETINKAVNQQIDLSVKPFSQTILKPNFL
jgi:SNF2 family DNA or RNA helicase